MATIETVEDKLGLRGAGRAEESRDPREGSTTVDTREPEETPTSGLQHANLQCPSTADGAVQDDVPSSSTLPTSDPSALWAQSHMDQLCDKCRAFVDLLEWDSTRERFIDFGVVQHHPTKDLWLSAKAGCHLCAVMCRAICFEDATTLIEPQFDDDRIHVRPRLDSRRWLDEVGWTVKLSGRYGGIRLTVYGDDYEPFVQTALKPGIQ